MITSLESYIIDLHTDNSTWMLTLLIFTMSKNLSYLINHCISLLYLWWRYVLACLLWNIICYVVGRNPLGTLNRNWKMKLLVFWRISKSQTIVHFILTIQENGIDMLSSPQVTFLMYHGYFLLWSIYTSDMYIIYISNNNNMTFAKKPNIEIL